MESRHKRTKIVKDLNDDDGLVISSFGVVLEINERGEMFYKALRDIVERTYRNHFHLQYKNKSNDSKNQVMHILQEAFSEPWSMRPVRLQVENTKNKKKSHIKGIITKHVISIMCSNNYQINLFCYIYFHVHLRKNYRIFFRFLGRL
jgi:hypothetical protein